MNCIAIDDEPKALTIIRHYISKVPFLDLLQDFRSSLDALAFLNKNSTDLIFLDINMPDLNGIDFLHSLTNSPLIIFTTAYSEYAVQSYDYKTVGYLLKPITFPAFLKATNKAATLHAQQVSSSNLATAEEVTRFILIKSGPQTHQLLLQDICYIEASGNHILIHLRDRKIIAATSLTDFMEKLPKRTFSRVHKSFIIAHHHVQSFERHQVKVAGMTIPVGRTYRSNFLQNFSK